MKTKDIIKDALRDFDGTLILVSHDRDFLDGLAEKVEFGNNVSKNISKISSDSWRIRKWKTCAKSRNNILC